MSYREDNKQKPNKFLTPMIAVGAFLIFVVISALLSRQSIRRFLIILLLFSIIALCGYFIYCLRQAEKEKRKEDPDQDEAVLRRRMPLRTELSAQDDEPMAEVTEGRGYSSYEYESETSGTDNMFGMEDEPMAFDTNRARRPADASIIRREDPGEGDFEDYQLEMEEIPEPQEQPVGAAVSSGYAQDSAAEEDNGLRYERRPIERPAFRGFTRTLENSPEAFASETERPVQHHTTFEPARESSNLFHGKFASDAEEEQTQQTPESSKPIRETTFSVAKPFSIPSLDDEEPAVADVAEPEKVVNTDEVVRPASREHRRIPEVGTSDKGYKDSYKQEDLFRGTGAATPTRPSKPADTGLFGGSGYKSPFDK